jgi:hypothetical protein
MTKKVLRKTLNPKKPEEYLKMFEKYLKFTNSSNLSDSSSWLLEATETIKNKIQESLSLVKNDRIESYLKYYRAHICYSATTQYEGDDFEEGRKYCIKEVESYLKNLIKNQAEENSDDYYLPVKFEVDIDELIHFIDLYNSNKDYWRSINNYSWANKSMAKIISDLSENEEELAPKKQFSLEKYNRLLDLAESTLEYLKVDEKYTWYLIESNQCEFESYINEHCGADRYAKILFSLRSKTPDGYWDSHVTVSTDIKKVDKEKFNTPGRGKRKSKKR